MKIVLFYRKHDFYSLYDMLWHAPSFFIFSAVQCPRFAIHRTRFTNTSHKRILIVCTRNILLRSAHDIPIHVKLQIVQSPLAELRGKHGPIPHRPDKFRSPRRTHDRLPDDHAIVSHRQKFLHLIGSLHPAAGDRNDRPSRAREHARQLDRLIRNQLPRDPIAIAHHDILRQRVQRRPHLVVRVTLHDRLQSDHRGQIQKVLEGGSQHPRDEEYAVRPRLLRQSELYLVHDDVLHDDCRVVVDAAHRSHGALELSDVAPVGVVIDVDEHDVRAQSHHGLGDQSRIVVPRELLPGIAQRGLSLDVRYEAPASHGRFCRESAGEQSVLLFDLRVGLDGGFVVGVGDVVGIVVDATEGGGEALSFDALLGVAHGHADGVGEGGVLGVEAFHFVFLAVDRRVDVFLLASAALL
mmetsp:Transcript_38806/g.81260  ORF Transcript_38806/g.81260 Transcript_38806/m.81260 type:complete len:409 (+) Transcript_38806:60-1286(+)